MDEKDFVLQSRYEVRPTSNSIIDLSLQQEVRLEPRLIKLLCILAQHSGQMVRREQLITEVWNDYGGGEAGLNNAISSLRKVLNDNSKELIETIPTKGYVLHGEITELQTATRKTSPIKRKFSKRWVVYASFILVLAIISFLLVKDHLNSKNDVALVQKGLVVPYEAAENKSTENWTNTIVTIGKDSTEYKLKVLGDRRPEFYINGKLLSPDEMERHLDLINSLKTQLQKRNGR